MAGVPGSSRIYHDNVAKDQSRVHYGDVHGDAYYGNVFNNKRDIAQEILASLRFPGMDRYHERPLDSFPGTYEWIFDGISTNFRQWRTSSNEIFLAQRKASSGKSCLMKFLSEHSQTTDLLHEWAGGEVSTVAFFFWAAGGELEKSQLGLMRSLLFQILNQHSDLIQSCLPQRWAAHERRANYEKPWSHAELREVVSRVLRHERMKSTFCFLIDGLDEFDGDHQDLIDYLGALHASGRVKLLVSSRPWNVFYAAYDNRPGHVWQLRLQDLTSRDIDLFITSRFESDPRFQAMLAREPSRDRFRKFSEQLRKRAEGVFLWVSLVTTTLRRGLGEHDNLSGLSKRLDLLPKELDAMLQHVFDSIEPIYEQLAARGFLILNQINHWGYIGLPLTWIVSLEHGCEKQSADSPVLDTYEQDMEGTGRLQAATQAIRRCFRDFVTIEFDPWPLELEEIHAQDFPRGFVGAKYIQFGHRSMFDFIRSKVRSGLLQAMAGSSFDPTTSTCRLLVQASPPSLPMSYGAIVFAFMDASKQVSNPEQIEADLVSLGHELIDIGRILGRDGHSLWGSLGWEMGRYLEPMLNIVKNDDFELQAATLVGCAALKSEQERLFWSLLTAEPHYNTSKSRRAWARYAFCKPVNKSAKPCSLLGTTMKLYDESESGDPTRRPHITAASVATPSDILHDICEELEGSVRGLVIEQVLMQRIVHIVAFLVARGAALEPNLTNVYLCDWIRDWCKENVNLDELSTSSPTPSYTVEYHWGGLYLTDLNYDPTEVNRQLWPSLKQVSDHCQKVRTELRDSLPWKHQ
ncbi:hypothetical protein AC578_1179 [Pseudocercospora eumusae]|uniref:Nephrocystin 3-like N-terminal domain-containing protein n=1 Tax=Pseudocercospora eumusae TaxID=321146 RepID=A0A139H0C6_9PEZI|nr:hypothetical protein AC578_1179 [Pseudocercospora eumusae]